MSSPQFAQYSGAKVLPFAHHGHGPGVCKSCGCDSGDCRCGCRQCRKEAKELVFTPDASTVGKGNITGGLAAAYLAHRNAADPAQAKPAADPTILQFGNLVTAFIGGGCCVHISLEYAPVTATASSSVLIAVADTEGTIMMWEKTDPAGTHYQIKENVMTTKPGATIALFAENATVRARWCEVFSC